jgi:hypothetical protein
VNGAARGMTVRLRRTLAVHKHALKRSLIPLASRSPCSRTNTRAQLRHGDLG